MQSLDIASQSVDLILNSGANMMYDKYIDSKTPAYYSNRQIIQLKQICQQQYMKLDHLKVDTSEIQPIQISKDNMGFKQIIHKKQPIIQKIMSNRLSSSQKKRPASNNWTTRPSTTSLRKTSPYFRSKPQSQFIKLTKDQVKMYEQPTMAEIQMRRTKSNQIQHINKLNQNKIIEEQHKKAELLKLQKQYSEYCQNSMRTTFGFDGKIIPIIQKHANKNVVCLQSGCFENSKIKKGHRHKILNNKNKLQAQPINQMFSSNIFTSLIYQISLRNSKKQQSKFNQNDIYNNNNFRQTTHSNFIKLEKGVDISQPINNVNLRTKTTKKDRFFNKTSTFKHFLTNYNQNKNQVRKDYYESVENSQQQQQQIKKQSKIGIQSQLSTAYKLNKTHRFSSTNKDSINPFTGRRNSLNITNSFNNGNQKLNIEPNAVDILFN